MSDFDPDAYLASKAKSAPFDPDAYLASKAPKAAPQEHASTGSFLDPDNVKAFLEASRDNLPAVGSLATKGAAALEAGIQAPFSDKTFGQIYDENLAMDAKDQAKRRAEHPISDVAGSMAGAMVMPTPGAKMKGVAGLATRIGSNMAMSGADTYARTGDADEAAKSGKVAGLVSAGVEAIPYVGKALGAGGKKIGSALFGVGEGATERYLANPEAVRGAKNFKGVTDDFLAHMDSTRAGLGEDSSKAFEMLKGKSAPAEVFSKPIKGEIERLTQGGDFSEEAGRTLKKLEYLEASIARNSDESGHLPFEKGKNFIMQLDDLISKARATNAGKQELVALSKIRQDTDRILKLASPEYKAHMAELAGDTTVAKDIGDKFKSDNGAQKLLERVTKGKDEYSKDALKAYDERFGQTFGEDLQNSYAKNAFEQPTINGSRRTGPGAAIGATIGAAVGGPAGAAIGSAASSGTGAMIDKYGGKIWQSVLDGTLNVGPYAKVLENAFKTGPAQVAVVHNFLLKTDPKYKALVEGSSPQP